MEPTSGNERCEDFGFLCVYWPAANAGMELPVSLKGCSGGTQADVHIYDVVDFCSSRPPYQRTAEMVLEWLDPHAWDYDERNVEAPRYCLGE